MLSVEEQLHIFQTGVASIDPHDALVEKLKEGRPLNIKLGVDPTTPDLHIGHAVSLRKMRQLQDIGHKVTLIIGGGTALIGDPSGRDVTRPQLTPEEVESNAATYIDQAMKVLDAQRTTIVNNAEWICSLNLEGMLKLCSQFTVARILERDDFTKRYTNHQPISLHEFLYPVMQAYDSVVIKADIEFGGTDQLFNLLAGRALMEKMGMPAQICITMPLLEGTDGSRKMSKSYGNYIGLTDDPQDMFGKVMSIPDTMILRYYRLASSLSVAEVDKIEHSLQSSDADPYQLKRALARDIVTTYHSGDLAQDAEAAFDKLFKDKTIPTDLPSVSLSTQPNEAGLLHIPAVLREVGFAKSNSEARRLIDQGGCRIDGQPLAPQTYDLPASDLVGHVLQAGKRNFIKIEP